VARQEALEAQVTEVQPVLRVRQAELEIEDRLASRVRQAELGRLDQQVSRAQQECGGLPDLQERLEIKDQLGSPAQLEIEGPQEAPVELVNLAQPDRQGLQAPQARMVQQVGQVLQDQQVIAAQREQQV